jgi:Family of unknown function (DUF6235)
MSAPLVPASRPSHFTVTSGLDLLDEWMADASQSQKNIVTRVLFAVADKTVFTEYTVIDDVENHMEYFVLAKSDLAVKIRIDGFDAFAIVYIGPSCTAPGLDPPGPADAVDVAGPVPKAAESPVADGAQQKA